MTYCYISEGRSSRKTERRRARFIHEAGSKLRPYTLATGIKRETMICQKDAYLNPSLKAWTDDRIRDKIELEDTWVCHCALCNSEQY